MTENVILALIDDFCEISDIVDSDNAAMWQVDHVAPLRA